MSDKKKVKLPIIDSEPLLVHSSQGVKFFSATCFKPHSSRKVSVQYHLRGLVLLHQGYWATDEGDRHNNFKNAFGLFHLASNTDRDYFCAREAMSHVAGLLGEESIEGGEKYTNSISKGPGLVEPLLDEEDHNPAYNCHLIHPGFYSASDLSKLEAELLPPRK